MSAETVEPRAVPTSVVGRVVVRRAERVSPSFVRVWLGGEVLADFGTTGPMLDQRIKLIFPGDAATLPPLDPAGDWYADWLALPDPQRGSMRTYTPRDVVGDGADRQVVVDVVVHEHGPTGPGNAWALSAAPGAEAVVVGPRRDTEWGGIEFAPGDAERVLVVGDETAAPAAYGILRDLPADARGCVLLEVPTSADVLDDLRGPDGVDVEWLPRDGAERGARLWAATLRRLGEDDWRQAPPEVADEDVEDLVWDTPEVAHTPDAGPYSGLYAWIAGEAKVVTGLRRHLVKDLGVDRSQVAFMGYWREGVAMKG